MKRIGIYNPYLETRGGGEKVCLATAAELAKDNHVTMIVYKPVNLKSIGQYLDVDTSKLHMEAVKVSLVAKVIHRLPLVPQGVKNFFSDFTVYRTLRRKNYDLFINNCVDSNLPNPAKRGIYACMFPHTINHGIGKSPFKQAYHWLLRVLYRLTIHPNKATSIDTYTLVTANSAYTQGHIKKLWGRNSEIIYPICDNMMSRKHIPKEKIIISVGRFFAKTEVNHHKRHDFLVERFAKMKNLHNKGWQLHLVGSVAEDADTLKYILSLLNAAQGSPIFFHFNAPREELKQLFNRAQIYWHATGYGSDARKHPEKQEHFGITTVEAMSAGCIPIVINSAGQRESVTEDCGLLWNSAEELATYTNKVALMPAAKRKHMQAAAVHAAARFNDTAFAKQARESFNKLMAKTTK